MYIFLYSKVGNISHVFYLYQNDMNIIIFYITPRPRTAIKPLKKTLKYALVHALYYTLIVMQLVTYLIPFLYI